MMFVHPEITLRVDLNALHGDRVTTPKSAIMSPLSFLLITPLSQGDYVRAVEEEGDTYVGVVEQIAGDRIHLRLLLNTWAPASPIFEPDPMRVTQALLRMDYDDPPETQTIQFPVDLKIA